VWQIEKSGREWPGKPWSSSPSSFSIWDHRGELPECLHHADSEGHLHCSPGSRCPGCMTPIKPYDNVPVFGWLWLCGKCRACGSAISPMYPLMELATGLLFVAAFLEFGITQTTVKWLFFYVLDPDSDGNRLARTAAAGRGELAGVLRRTAVLGVCAVGPRTRGFSHVALPASANAGIRG